VSLDWDTEQSASQVLPWQAQESAIKVNDDQIYVQLGNRGSQPAADVTVRVWWHEWRDDHSPPPKWDPNDQDWIECDPPAGQTKDVAAGTATDSGPSFGPFTHTPPKDRYIVLAQATCKDDRANIDPLAHLPCSRRATELVDLVANDNNLGLRVVEPQDD
jgi:hypothetical protein